MNETPAAASPAPPASGQAADPAQQGAAAPAGQQPSQGGQAPPAAQGQQGAQPAPAAQPAAPTGEQPPAPPERYELRLPEGTTLDATDVEAVATLAKDQAWSQEQAQLTLDEMHKQVSAQSATFRSELIADPELGGANIEQTQLLANRVLDRFLPASDPAGARLRSTLNRTGYGSFLPLAKLLAGIGKAMSEDQPRMGASAAAFAEPKRSQADRLFGDSPGIGKPGT